MLGYKGCECLNCIRNNKSMDLDPENDLFFTEVFLNMTALSIIKYKITVFEGWQILSQIT